MAETGDVAAGLIGGDKLYQKRARRALPILVRQAIAHRTMFYTELASELGMSNPRNMNFPLGAIGNTILHLAETWGRPVPPIQALVVNKSTGLPGVGIAWRVPASQRRGEGMPPENRSTQPTVGSNSRGPCVGTSLQGHNGPSIYERLA